MGPVGPISWTSTILGPVANIKMHTLQLKGYSLESHWPFSLAWNNLNPSYIRPPSFHKTNLLKELGSVGLEIYECYFEGNCQTM